MVSPLRYTAANNFIAVVRLAHDVCPISDATHSPNELAYRIFGLLMASSSSPKEPQRVSAPISLAQIRRLFARPERVAQSQFLRREISGRMFERLSLIKINPEQILDAGCGEGDDLLTLRQHFPRSALLGLDAALPMLSETRQREARSWSGMQRLMRALRVRSHHLSAESALVCADFGQLPLKAAAMDMVWSNLALHWHPQPHRVLAEWARVLRVDGLLMFCCFGPDTFKELREVAAVTGAHARVLPFVDLHDYGDMLVDAGFASPVMDMEKLNITYSSATKLLADVRAFGGNPLEDRSRGLMSRQQGLALRRALEQLADRDGRLKLTIEVIYGHAFRARPRTTGTGEPIVHFERRKI
jgi:malonyl-CoA O-methyltransferase